MFNLPQSEQKKIVNKSAKALGLFARKQNATINNKQAYKLEERATGLTVLENCTLNSLYVIAETDGFSQFVR